MKTTMIKAVLLTICFVAATTQAKILTFEEADFSAPSPLPGLMIDADGKMHISVLPGYTVGDWWTSQTVIQILQADVNDDSEIGHEVNAFAPVDDYDVEDEAEESDILQSVQVEADAV